MTPREIAEYIYSEFTPLSKMSQEDAMLHVEQLILQSITVHVAEAVITISFNKKP